MGHCHRQERRHIVGTASVARLCDSLPEQGASFTGPVPTAGVHAVCGYPVNMTSLHHRHDFDLEPVVQANQFDALSFREGLDPAYGEYESAPVAGQACDFGF